MTCDNPEKFYPPFGAPEIAEKEMGGIQLFAGDVWKDSDFRTFYKINSIPRFILLDPEGIIINPDAPRPSSPKLKKLFNSLNI